VHTAHDIFYNIIIREEELIILFFSPPRRDREISTEQHELQIVNTDSARLVKMSTTPIYGQFLVNVCTIEHFEIFVNLYF